MRKITMLNITMLNKFNLICHNIFLINALKFLVNNTLYIVYLYHYIPCRRYLFSHIMREKYRLTIPHIPYDALLSITEFGK